MAAAKFASLISGTIKSGWDPKVAKLSVGAFAELGKTFTPEEVHNFAALTGDDNPVHKDAAYAATTQFKRPIVHGLLYASLIPTIFGATIVGSIYVSQTFKFKRPVYFDERVVARVEVVGVREAPVRGGAPGAKQQFVTCSTVVRKGDGLTGDVCLEGEATVLLPPATAEAAAVTGWSASN